MHARAMPRETKKVSKLFQLEKRRQCFASLGVVTLHMVADIIGKGVRWFRGGWVFVRSRDVTRVVRGGGDGCRSL